MSEKLRVYVDTSVIGGCFDKPFAAGSVRLFRLAENGRLIFLISEVTRRELEPAPPQVRGLLATLPLHCIEEIMVSEAAIRLRDAYIEAGIVGPKWLDDALHVALATVVKADAIVSWNFKHIVRLDKMKAYNAVNQQAGYGTLTIVSPNEVSADENT
jgi:predicted nucleic acid-binding protein